MNHSEAAIVFACVGEELLGIVAVPEATQHIGVLVIVGGPQYRVGSHRQFALLSRNLAAAGYAVMRFDCRGMGDSSGECRDFERFDEDIGAAIDAFQAQCPQVERIVLWGLCDAASASLLYLDTTADARVAGLVLLNPWVRSDVSQAKTHVKHYYGQRLLQAEFWRKLFTGKLGIGRALSGFIVNLKRAQQSGESPSAGGSVPFQTRMVRGLQSFTGPVLIVLSGNDYTAKEFIEVVQADTAWQRCMACESVTRIDVSDADHTFSSAAARAQVEELTRQWLDTKVRQ